MSDIPTDNYGSSNNRLVLLLIGGIPLTMILAATWLWYFVARGDLDLVGALGTANRGTLLQPPRQLDDVGLSEPYGAAVKYADLPRKWMLVVPNDGGSCDAACENLLYLTRQIHVAMGKDFSRIGRLYLSESAPGQTTLEVAELSDGRPAPADFAGLLETEHRGLRALALSAGGYDRLFPEQVGNPTTWYLADPAGWVMMSYNSDVTYKDVISDLKFLLKNSSE